METNFDNVMFQIPFKEQSLEPVNLKITKCDEDCFHFVFTDKSSNQLFNFSRRLVFTGLNSDQEDYTFSESDFVFTVNLLPGLIYIKFGSKVDFKRFKKFLVVKEIRSEKEVLNDAFFDQELKHKAFEEKAGAYLKDVLEKMINAYKNDPDAYYGPFTTISQSSGFGKSKQIEALSHDWFVVYCNFKEEDPDSMPQQSKLRDLFIPFCLLTEDSLESHLEAYYCYFLEKIIKILESGENVAEDKKRLFMELSSNENVDEIVNALWKNIEFFSDKQINESLRKLKDIKNDFGNEKIIFVFDSVNELNNKKCDCSYKKYITVIRRRLKSLPSNCFVIFIERPTYLSYLILESELPKEKSNCLLGPIYLLPTWDLFSNYDQINLEQVQDVFNLFSYGRPFWGAYLNQLKDLSNKRRQEKQIMNLVVVAVNFLEGRYMCNRNERFNEGELAIALIGCRTQINIDPLSISAKNLVSSFLAICLYVDETRRLLNISYSSEPILAEASARICSYLKYEKVIERFSSFVNNGVINESNMGLLVAKIILLICNDKACESATEQKKDYYRFTKALKVDHFLKVFMGQDNFSKFNETNKNIESYDKLMSSTIFFNHFTHIDKIPSQALLQKLFKRCAACICKANKVHADLIIPVLIDENDLNKMSYIFIKVKNHSNPSRIALSKLHFINPISIMGVDDKFPFISLYLQIGQQESDKSNSIFLSSELTDDISEVIEMQEATKAEVKANNPETASYNQKFQIGVVVLGLNQRNFPFLKDEEIKHLNKLAKIKAEFGENLKDNERKLIDETRFIKA